MSVLIKGMEMPERVQLLELHPDGKVFTRKGYLVGEAVEVPKHGRLIDADELMADLKFVDATGEYYTEAQIEYAPTVIEAEGRA